MKHLPFFFIPLFLIACCKEKITVKPTGGSNAIPVYNQAYQENYDPDQISDILNSASNAYILLDPYTEEININQYVSQLQVNGNQIGAYISIGTGQRNGTIGKENIL